MPAFPGFFTTSLSVSTPTLSEEMSGRLVVSDFGIALISFD
jgi:hypothetical protein